MIISFRELWENAQKLAANSKHMKDEVHLWQVARDAWEGVLFLQGELQRVEGELDVGRRWTCDSPEYIQMATCLRI